MQQVGAAAAVDYSCIERRVYEAQKTDSSGGGSHGAVLRLLIPGIIVDASFSVFRHGAQIHRFADDPKTSVSATETTRNNMPAIPSDHTSIIVEGIGRRSLSLRSDDRPKLALCAVSPSLERHILCRFGIRRKLSEYINIFMNFSTALPTSVKNTWN